MLTMKSKICAAIAILGALALSHDTRSVHNYTAAIINFSILFVAQYLVITLYNVFIYPFYRSPLRHLPGPKVLIPRPPLLTEFKF